MESVSDSKEYFGCLGRSGMSTNSLCDCASLTAFGPMASETLKIKENQEKNIECISYFVPQNSDRYYKYFSFQITHITQSNSIDR